MNFPSFIRRKKKSLTFFQPAISVEVCESCGELYCRTKVEGISYPLCCPACGAPPDRCNQKDDSQVYELKRQEINITL